MKLNTCPFCGAKPEVNTHGTQADITCSGCGNASVGVQIIDLIPQEQRNSSGWNNETLCYDDRWRKLAEQEMAEMWNKRHISDLEEIIRQAYFIGLKDKADSRPLGLPYQLKYRVKQIKSDIEWQLDKGPIEPFSYDIKK